MPAFVIEISRRQFVRLFAAAMRYWLAHLRIRNALIERILAGMAVVAARGLFATVRRQMHFADPKLSPYQPPSETTCVYSVWHDSLLMPLFLGRQPATMALVGRHQDGTFLANSLAALGISCVRGSSSHGGTQAVRRLLDETRGRHIVVTPDGPRGPRRTMKTGVAFLASRTGKLVVPTGFACRHAWSWGAGWTDLVVPKPGTMVVGVAGKGIFISPDASRDELNHCNSLIQNEMDRLNTHATELAAAKETAVAEVGNPERNLIQ